MEALRIFLEKVKLGGKQSHLNMALFPLLASDAGAPDYLILEEAMGQGSVEITEVSHSGSVPDLRLINKSAHKLLVVDGEELVGAKQNRIVNATFLIAGLTEITIPVSCVEQGRWSYRSQKFASGKKVMPSSMRREHQKVVAMNLNEGAGYRSNQGMIWNELALKSERMAVHSSTGAMTDLFEGQKDRLGEYLRAFRLVECQVGAAFAINGKAVGLECFGHQETFNKFFPKLVQSYALDALDWFDESGKSQVSSESVRLFLEGVQNAPGKTHPALGLGENIRFEDNYVSGASLVLDGRVVHLSAFSHNGHKNDGTGIPFQRFSQRKRRG
ncbi:MAG: hypothetical protein FJ123_00200 [Deltaproteobacteria bacterium]|nr:hypothetical protein [Deltaproteobacteria bacterium]